MDKRTTGIIVTVVTALLCICCSLFFCVMGFGTITGNGTYSLGDSSDAMPPVIGYLFLCFSIIAIIVPIVVGFFMLRKKPEAAADSFPNEPLPPAA